WASVCASFPLPKNIQTSCVCELPRWGRRSSRGTSKPFGEANTKTPTVSSTSWDKTCWSLWTRSSRFRSAVISSASGVKRAYVSPRNRSGWSTFTFLPAPSEPPARLALGSWTASSPEFGPNELSQVASRHAVTGDARVNDLGRLTRRAASGAELRGAGVDGAAELLSPRGFVVGWIRSWRERTPRLRDAW